MFKVALHIDAHRALWKQFNANGTLLMVVLLLANLQVAPWASLRPQAAVEAFIAADLFVAHGVVARWTLREWNEVLAP